MSNHRPKYVIHDCDPGPDDAIALMLSLSSPLWHVEAITTVGGNIHVEKCASNARKIVELCGKKTPVYIGSDKPLYRDLYTLESVFTDSGLPGAEKIIDPGSEKVFDQSAVDFLVHELKDKEYILCATGPLTNIASAINIRPQITKNISHLVLMGGCFFPEPVRGESGNFKVNGTKGLAEFNFAIDPEAASIVLNSKISKISAIGLNITRKILFNSFWRDSFLEIGNHVGITAARILETVGESHKVDLGHLRTSENDPVRAVHDAITVVYMESPELFDTKDLYVKVETACPPAIAGQSLVSEVPKQGYSPHPICIVCDADVEKVFENIINSLSRYK